MKQRLSATTFCLAFLAVALAVPAGAGVRSGAPQTPVTVLSYTGCLTIQTGKLDDVAQGDSPLHPCKPGAGVTHLSGGDVTSVASGTGLAGGGDNGALS